jgi:SAM-dependent methyltransferase
METTQEIFERIYRDKLWGGRKLFWKRFYSGSGSTNKNVVGPYVRALTRPLSANVVVDIGCGDFSVGHKIAWLTKRYIACDIARPLIDELRRKNKYPHVEFRVLDAVNDELPSGDVVLVRQVLQHLSNENVARIAHKLTQYPTAIITEHLPAEDFVPNLDMPDGHQNRAFIGSGIVLTEPPFNLKPWDYRVLCNVPQHGGVIRTTLYRF